MLEHLFDDNANDDDDDDDDICCIQTNLCSVLIFLSSSSHSFEFKIFICQSTIIGIIII